MSPCTDENPHYFPSIVFRHAAAFRKHPCGAYLAVNLPFTASRTGGPAHGSNRAVFPRSTARRCIWFLPGHTGYFCFHCCRSLRGSSSFPPPDAELAAESRCIVAVGTSHSSVPGLSCSALMLRQEEAAIINKKLKTEITFFIILKFKSDPGAGLYR